MTQKQCQYLFDGRVQGVGFRYTTRQIVKKFNIAGYVKNLPSGQVELVMQGEPAELEQALAKIQRTFDQNITGTESSTTETFEQFSRFSIRF